MWKIIIGLMCVMISNILLGTSLATLKKNFNKTVFVNGIIKAILIVFSIGAMYLCSYLNPDIMITNVNGQDVNLISGMELLFIAGIMLYGFKSLVKLRDLLKLKTNIEERNGNNE